MRSFLIDKPLKLALATAPLALGVWLNTAPALADCAPAAADDIFAVCSGETVDQNDLNGFGTGIETDVTVQVLSGASVTGTNTGISLGDNATIDNAGTITSGFGTGIIVFQNSHVNNSGDIKAGTLLGGSGVGIAALENSKVTNSGTISSGRTGISIGANVSVTNSGIISGDSTAIDAFDNTRITNSGILASDSTGIDAGDNTSVANSGTITGSRFGIFADADNLSVTNSGSIVSDGKGALGSGLGIGIAANTITSLTNSGIIIGGNGTAIEEFGAGGDTRLTLLPGSVIVGRIRLGGGINTLEVGKGLNLASTFEIGLPDFADDTFLISGTGGAPFVVNGNQVIVVDPTGFAASEVWLDSLANSILNAVDANAASGGGLAGSGSADGGGAGGTRAELTQAGSAGSEQRVWGSFLGGYRSQEGKGANVDLDLAYGGALLGADAFRRGGLTLGAFVGGAVSEADQEFDAQDIDATSALGGFYLRQDWEPAWINLTLAGGWVRHDSERRIANNLAADGIDEARAEYDGYFAIPAVTFGARISEVLPNFSLEPSLRLHYAGLFLEGFEESGSAAALRVESRELHQAGARAQLALPYLIRGLDGEVFRLEGRLGLDGRLDLGDDRVDARVAGLPLDFEASFEDEVVSGFLGAGVSFTTPDGSTVIGASAEGRLGSDGSEELGGRLAAELRLLF